jgi:hypothetical protein
MSKWTRVSLSGPESLSDSKVYFRLFPFSTYLFNSLCSYGAGSLRSIEAASASTYGGLTKVK